MFLFPLCFFKIIGKFWISDFGTKTSIWFYLRSKNTFFFWVNIIESRRWLSRICHGEIFYSYLIASAMTASSFMTKSPHIGSSINDCFFLFHFFPILNIFITISLMEVLLFRIFINHKCCLIFVYFIWI